MKLDRLFNAGAVFFTVLGTVLLGLLDDRSWGAVCFITAFFCISLAAGRVK